MSYQQDPYAPQDVYAQQQQLAQAIFTRSRAPTRRLRNLTRSQVHIRHPSSLMFNRARIRHLNSPIPMPRQARIRLPFTRSRV